MSMDYQLDTASFRGVEFDVIRLRGEPSTRRWALYDYPGRDGADVEDRGRGPQRWQFTAIFYGEEYESDLGAFLKVVDAGKAGEFVHPTLGAFNARVSILGFEQSHEQRDVANLEIDVIEDGTATALPDLFSIGGLAAEVEFYADEVDTLNTDAVADVTTASNAARSWATDVKNGVSQATRAVNAVRHKIDTALNTMDRITDPNNWPVVRSLKRLSYSCQKLATRAKYVLPNLKEQTTSVPLPLALVSHKLYGSRAEADRLLEMNPHVRNPFAAEPGPLKTQVK